MTQRRCCLLSLLVVALALPGWVRAADNREVGIESRVRQALDKDAQLRTQNLHVRVSDGTASLSGPVPSLELKLRAVRIAADVEGVLRVRGGDLYFSRPPQPPPSILVGINDEPAVRVRSASPPRLAAPARLTVQARPPAPSASTSSRLEGLRRSDYRFQYIHTRIQGGLVYIFPGQTPLADVMRFAQAARRIPGLQQVIVAPPSR